MKKFPQILHPTSFLSGKINDFPVYKDSKTGISSKEIMDICVGQNIPEEKICGRVPTGITESAVFVVELEAVQVKDLTVDDNGVYGAHSSPAEHFQVFLDDQGKISGLNRIGRSDSETKRSLVDAYDHFVIRRQYSWSTNNKDFRRMIAKVEHESKFMRFAVVQYTVKMTPEEAKILLSKPYGGSRRSSEPHVRTKPSVLEGIRKMGQKSSAKQIISEIEKKAGGVISVVSPSDIARDRQQVYNQLRRVDGRKKARSTGPSKAPDITKLLSLQQAGRFMRDVSLGSRAKRDGGKRATASTFAATDYTLGWIKRYCQFGSSPAAVAGIDMTYKLGPFYLTTATLPNPMFVYKSNKNKHPTTLAAVMTSVSKEKRDYEYLARSLKSEGIASLVYGTDGECALESGFESVYPIENSTQRNIHLRCFDHAKGDILMKLKALNMSETTKKSIQQEILGSEFGGKRVQGLVDCESEAEFEQNYVTKESQWPEEFRQWMVTSKGRHRSMKNTLQHCMLKNVRIAAGLGNPPNKWDNQRTESINNIIKESADNHVTDQATIHEILETQVIQQQENEYIKAIYNMGEYRLAPEFQKFSVSPVAWSQKTPEQQREHVSKVLGEVPVLPSLEQTKITKRLSITVEESRLTSVAAGMLNQIWHEAEEILSRHKVIDLGEGVHCVTEYRNSVNVVVKGGSYTCRCRQSQSTAGICCHILVVADTIGNLSEFLKSYNQKKGKANNIVYANIPKRAGEKPKEKKKRKGQNNVKCVPILEEVQRPDNDIDFQKPLAFTEIWHNHNDFNVVFTRDCQNAKKCESCKVEFARGSIVCIPQDIAVLHRERYFYPKKDEQGKVTMEPTWKKEADKFYCVKKECILRRHPYFWKGMIKIGSDMEPQLKDGHLKLLKEVFHLSL